MFLVYDGSAKDHDVTPAVSRKGEDGRPMKRKYVQPAKYVFTPVDTYKLWGVEFPKGVPVEVTNAALIKKAQALGCFKETSAIEALAEPSGEEAPKRRRGRLAEPSAES